VPAALVVGLASRSSPTSRFKVKWPVRLGLLLPWALPLVFAGLIFRWFFEYQTGIVNDVLMRSGASRCNGCPARRSRRSQSALRSCGSRRRSWR
jgi:multiple sugar transport system permease protein